MTDSSLAAIPPGFSRRRFLAAGGAMVAAAMLLDGEVPSRPSGLEVLARANVPAISVGYLEGSVAFTSLAAALVAGARHVVPAVGLSSGASEMIGRAVTLRVHGVAPTTVLAPTSRFERIAVDSLISAPDAAHAGSTLPFYAWTFRRGSAAPNGSRVDIAGDEGLRVGLSLDVKSESSSGVSSTRVMTSVLTSGRHGDLPKLHPGIYLLALDEGTWSTPRDVPAVDDPAWDDLASVVLSANVATPR